MSVSHPLMRKAQDCRERLKITMADIVPVYRGSKEATFTALAADFVIDDKSGSASSKGTLRVWKTSVLLVDEKEIEAFVAAEDSLKGPEQRLQIARVRHAWTAVRQNGLRNRTATPFRR